MACKDIVVKLQDMVDAEHADGQLADDEYEELLAAIEEIPVIPEVS